MARKLITGLVTGAIRDIVDFTLTLSDLTTLRLDGVVGDIVVSTWMDEVDQFKGLRQRLSQNGVVLLETAPVPRDIQPLGLWSTWQQTKALSCGLNACDPASFVLKTRTDKARHIFKRFTPHLRSGSLPVRQLGDVPLQFHSRIMVDHVRTATPFLINDMVVCGHHSDLTRVARFDGRMDAFCFPSWMGPESRWLLPPFYEIPIIQTFFNHVHGAHFALALLRWARSGNRDMLPKFALRVLAAYYIILYTHFHVVSAHAHADEFRFIDLFDVQSRRAVYPLRSNRGIFAQFNSQAVVDQTVTGSWPSDDQQGAQFKPIFHEILETISDNKVDWLAPEDWDALGFFERRYGGGYSFLRRVSVKTDANWNAVDHLDGEQSLSVESAIQLLLNNAGTPQEDRDMVQKFIQQKIEHDINLAGIYLAIGKSYLGGQFGYANAGQGQWWLKEAAKLRNADAQFDFARLVYSETANQTASAAQDREQALVWLRDVANRRDDARQFLDSLKLGGN